MTNYTASILTADGSDIEDVDLRDLDTDRLDALRADAATHGDTDLVATIDQVLAAR